jgi:hypothetical protein
MVRSVGTATEIEAPIEQGWSVLVDVDSFPAWNPFTVSVRTDFELGSPVDMQVCLRGRRRRDGSPHMAGGFAEVAAARKQRCESQTTFRRPDAGR